MAYRDDGGEPVPVKVSREFRRRALTDEPFFQLLIPNKPEPEYPGTRPDGHSLAYLRRFYAPDFLVRKLLFACEEVNIVLIEHDPCARRLRFRSGGAAEQLNHRFDMHILNILHRADLVKCHHDEPALNRRTAGGELFAVKADEPFRQSAAYLTASDNDLSAVLQRGKGVFLDVIILDAHYPAASRDILICRGIDALKQRKHPKPHDVSCAVRLFVRAVDAVGDALRIQPLGYLPFGDIEHRMDDISCTVTHSAHALHAAASEKMHKYGLGIVVLMVRRGNIRASSFLFLTLSAAFKELIAQEPCGGLDGKPVLLSICRHIPMPDIAGDTPLRTVSADEITVTIAVLAPYSVLIMRGGEPEPLCLSGICGKAAEPFQKVHRIRPSAHGSNYRPPEGDELLAHHTFLKCGWTHQCLPNHTSFYIINVIPSKSKRSLPSVRFFRIAAVFFFLLKTGGK